MIINPDGTIRKTNNAAFGLKELQGIVGGYIETIYLDSDIVSSGRQVVMIVNEEGRRKSLPINNSASILTEHYSLRWYDFIFGNVVLAIEDDEGNTVGLLDAERNEIIQRITED